MELEPITHLEKSIAGTVAPVTHLEKVIEQYGGGGGGAGLDDSFKDALMDCFANVAWATEDGQQYYDALEAALYPLDHITAVYTQSGTVYDTDSLDSLKADLIVTAFYQGGGSKTVTGYTLSGTLTVGTSTITVGYSGKTADFTVMVTHSAIPSGYIKNGLVFFLDGKSAQSGEWVDIVGSKSFTLTDCTVSSNGVVFNGTSSKGICSGQITSDWGNETIEVVISGYSDGTALQRMSILSQPEINSANGIDMLFAYEGSYTKIAIVSDGTNRTFKTFQKNLNARCLSASASNAVVNGTEQAGTGSTTFSANTSGNTYLGAYGEGSAEIVRYFGGTIHAVRIYNRKLSVAEMQANQQTDMTYYGLS